MPTKPTSLLLQNKIFAWIAVATVLILFIPWIAMQIGTEVNWDQTDFIVMGALMFGSASGFVLVARQLRTTKEKLIAGLVVLGFVLWLWVELAVGIFTNWGS